jgi:hypothetical protein
VKVMGLAGDALEEWRRGGVKQGHLDGHLRGGSNSLRPRPLFAFIARRRIDSQALAPRGLVRFLRCDRIRPLRRRAGRCDGDDRRPLRRDRIRGISWLSSSRGRESP